MSSDECCKAKIEPSCNFQWMKPNEEGQLRIESVRAAFMTLEKDLRNILPWSRETSLVWTNLEQACMWATKSLCLSNVNTDPTIFERSQVGNGVTVNCCGKE